MPREMELAGEAVVSISHAEILGYTYTLSYEFLVQHSAKQWLAKSQEFMLRSTVPY